MIGIGVIANYLGGNEESVAAYRACLGKTISKVYVKDDAMRLEFDEVLLVLQDEGQSCCEHRFMVCDDNLEHYKGAQLLEITIEDAHPDVTGEWGDVNEVQFMHVKTTKGSFTVSNHNQHNGYYGGFSIRASLESVGGDDEAAARNR